MQKVSTHASPHRWRCWSLIPPLKVKRINVYRTLCDKGDVVHHAKSIDPYKSAQMALVKLNSSSKSEEDKCIKDVM